MIHEGEVVSITQMVNEDGTVNCYQIVIDVINQPKLRMGKCAIQQGESD